MLAVAVGGALGAVARFWLSGLVGRRFGEVFPWGTLVVNVSGAFAAGAAVVAFGPDAGPSALARTAILIGFLGGYTTVSSFALQTLNLARVKENAGAAANVAMSVLLPIVAAAAGAALASGLA